MAQPDSDQRREGRVIMVGRSQRDQSKTMYEWPTDMDRSVGTDCGSGGGEMGEEGKGGKSGTTVIE